MKDTISAIIFSIICLLVIIIPLLFLSSDIAQFFILLIGIIAILFQKFLHQQSICECSDNFSDYLWCLARACFTSGD